jgi:NDP-sugar pyrophosphorylase family protein
VVVESNAAIAGPSIVGPGSRIGSNAILSHVVAWSGCEVGAWAILSGCILLTGSSVEPELVVRDAIYSRDAVDDLFDSQAASDYWGLYLPTESAPLAGRSGSAAAARVPAYVSGPRRGPWGGRAPAQV